MANTESQYAIPESLLPFAGQIMDSDAHESFPVNHWVDNFGSISRDMADAYDATDTSFAPPREHDDTTITAENVWQVKLSNAPGAFDMKRRLEVMDFTGIKRQLMFSGGVGLGTLMLYYLADRKDFMPSISGDRKAYARAVADAYNDWCARQQRETDRIVPVALVLSETVDELTTKTLALLKKGVRAFWVPSSVLPGGVSPAHPDLDRFYDAISAANATLSFHPSGDKDDSLLKTNGWRDVPAFEGYRIDAELRMDPWSFVSMSRAVEVFILTMVLGGVFERHPKLRVCVAEYSADWIGPLAYRMDMWTEFLASSAKLSQDAKLFQLLRQDNRALTLKPSEYVARNIRITPLQFEDVGGYIRRFGLEDSYVYASDFPHIEGGRDPMHRFHQSLIANGLDGDGIKKFFVTNAEWIMPD